MAKWNQIAYLIYDELKLKSDDSTFTIEHIVFMMVQYRSLILKQRYTDQKKDIPATNYQTICLDVEANHDCTTGLEVKSVQKIPEFVNLNGHESIKINPIGARFSTLEYVLIPEERLPYTGNNKWLKNIIYFATGSDDFLYLKSQNVDFKYLQKVELSALFDDPIEAGALSCDSEGNSCDYMETNFPLEAALVPILIELIVKELTPLVYKPEDEVNDASDGLSGIG